MRNIKAKIISNIEVKKGFFRMAVESPYLARRSKPGQFVEARCTDSVDPLLRRPLGVHMISKDGIELLYEIAGRGTEILSRRKAGDSLDVIGPLGNGFNLSAKRYPLNAILIAGGIGVAPLLALAEKIIYSARSTVHRKKKKLYVLLGARTKSQILCRDDFKKIGAEITISTDDGSEGKCGFITDCLASLLSTIDYRTSTIYACGPSPMLRETAKIALEHDIPCQVSLEEKMACGVGVCLGCPVKTKSGYKMVCKDGPVFDSQEILW